MALGFARLSRAYGSLQRVACATFAHPHRASRRRAPPKSPATASLFSPAARKASCLRAPFGQLRWPHSGARRYAPHPFQGVLAADFVGASGGGLRPPALGPARLGAPISACRCPLKTGEKRAGFDRCPRAEIPTCGSPRRRGSSLRLDVSAPGLRPSLRAAIASRSCVRSSLRPRFAAFLIRSRSARSPVHPWPEDLRAFPRTQKTCAFKSERACVTASR